MPSDQILCWSLTLQYKSRVDGGDGRAACRAPKQDLSSATGNAPSHARTSCLGEVESDPLWPLIRKACVTLSYVTTSVGGAPTTPICIPGFCPLRCGVCLFFCVFCHVPLCALFSVTCAHASRFEAFLFDSVFILVGVGPTSPHLLVRLYPCCLCLPLFPPALVRQLCAPVMSCASPCTRASACVCTVETLGSRIHVPTARLWRTPCLLLCSFMFVHAVSCCMRG